MKEQATTRGEDKAADQDPDITSAFGELLRTFRKARRLRQLDLGREAFLDHSAISRLETGERLPTADELLRLTSVLGLSEVDRDRLRVAFERAVREHVGLQSDILLHSDECLLIAESQLADARQLRLLGKPQLGAAIAGRTAGWLRLLSRRSSRQTTQDAMYRALGDVLVEQCKSYLDYLLPAELADVLSQSLEEQNRVARHLADPRLDLLRRMNCEGVLYLQGNHGDAYQFSKSFVEESKVDPRWQPELLRAATINAGYVADIDGLRDAGRVIEQVLAERDDLNDTDRAFILEGLARGQAAAGDTQAIATIERAGDLIQQSKVGSDFSAFRWVQIVRTKLRVFGKLGIRPPGDVAIAASEALATSERLGYLRHGREIASLLDAATG